MALRDKMWHSLHLIMPLTVFWRNFQMSQKNLIMISVLLHTSAILFVAGMDWLLTVQRRHLLRWWQMMWKLHEKKDVSASGLTVLALPLMSIMFLRILGMGELWTSVWGHFIFYLLVSKPHLIQVGSSWSSRQSFTWLGQLETCK